MQARWKTAAPSSASRHGAVAAEQRGHVDRESGVAHPAGEARDMRADARHLAHDDHRRARPATYTRLVTPSSAISRAREILQRIVLASCSVRRHVRCSYLESIYWT